MTQSRNTDAAPGREATAELLARYLARTAPSDDGALALSGLLLRRFGDLGGVCAAAAEAAPEAALALVAEDLRLLQALAERLARPTRLDRRDIGSSQALRDYVCSALAGRSREQFRALFLDRRNRLLAEELVAEGTVDHAPVYPREVVRRALELAASSLILVHNHPTGDPEPSRADIAMTRQVVEAARALGLQVHDHLVVGRDGVASFRALGLM